MNRRTIDVIDANELLDSPRPRSGRAVWDERGNSVWEWQTQPGVFTRDISDLQLAQLEASHLSLVVEPELPVSREQRFPLRRAG